MSEVSEPDVPLSVARLIPCDWNTTSLGEIADPNNKFSFRGGPFGSDLKSDDYTPTGIRVLQLQDIGEGIFLNKSNVRTSESKSNELLASNVYPGDILLAKMTPVARCCLVPAFEARYLMCSDGIRLAVDEVRFNKYYIFQALNGPEFRMVAESKSTGSTRGRIGLSELKSIHLPIPPLPEQQKIAAVLTAVDDKLDVIARQFAATKTLKQGLMQTLFSRGLGMQDANGRWVPHTEFKNSELGEIPAVWDVRSLGSVADVERGKFSARPRNDPKYFEEGDIPFIQTGDIAAANRFVRTGSQFLNKEGLAVSKMFPAGTIFITIAANIGDIAISQIPLSCPDSVVGINATTKECDGLWLYYLLSNNKEYFDSRATQNAQKNINLQVLRPFLLAMPPLGEQRIISEILTVVDDKLDALQVKRTHYQTLKRGLMQKLLTGEWRVKLDAVALAA